MVNKIANSEICFPIVSGLPVFAGSLSATTRSTYVCDSNKQLTCMSSHDLLAKHENVRRSRNGKNIYLVPFIDSVGVVL